MSDETNRDAYNKAQSMADNAIKTSKEVATLVEAGRVHDANARALGGLMAHASIEAQQPTPRAQVPSFHDTDRRQMAALSLRLLSPDESRAKGLRDLETRARVLAMMPSDQGGATSEEIVEALRAAGLPVVLETPELRTMLEEVSGGISWQTAKRACLEWTKTPQGTHYIGEGPTAEVWHGAELRGRDE